MDDANVRSILPQVKRPVTTYGFAADAQVRAENVVPDGQCMRFDAVWVNGETHREPIVLNTPGRHNVLNALATIAIALGAAPASTPSVRVWRSFSGVGRRFQRYGEVPVPTGGSFTLVDDYGHHPVEMAATLAAARGFPWAALGAGLPAAPLFAHLRDLFGTLSACWVRWMVCC